MISLHYDAVLARLNGDADISGRVHDSALLTPKGELLRDTYWILYGGNPDELGDDRLTAPQLPDSDSTFVYTVRSISPTAEGARRAAERALLQLVGFAPTITGRSCHKITHSRATEVQPDNTVKPPLFYGDDRYTLVSDRA